jgi:iron complex transport system substrate-binding protein
LRIARIAALLAISCALALGQAGPAVTDSLGRTVALPAKARRIVAIQPEIARMIVALGAGEALVGLDYSLRTRDPLFKLVYPEEGRLPVVSNSENSVNLEIVLKLSPDVVFVSPFERKIVEALERKTRIPTVAIASLGDFGRMTDEMSLLGRILGRDDRAAELIAVFKKETARVHDAVAGIPDAKKPKVYLAFWGSLNRTPTSYAPVEAAGGINLASGIVPDVLGAVQTTVSLERIIRWDPDVILVHGNYLPSDRRLTVERILGDRRLASLRAVRSGRVRYTFGFWDWWDMAEVTLETLYLAAIFYPGRFPDFDLVRSGEEIFSRFYGRTGVFAAFADILGCREWADD